MVSVLSRRSIIEGALILACGYALSGYAATSAANLGGAISPFLLLGAGLAFLLVPLAAGARSALLAESHRISHGVLAGVAGAMLVSSGVVFVVRAPLAPAQLLLLAATLVAIAWLGAVIGAFVASRRGP